MGGKSGGNEAAMARQDEQQRQERIRAGTKQINSIFDGQTTGAGKIDATAAFDPNANYFTQAGAAWKPDQTLIDALSAPMPEGTKEPRFITRNTGNGAQQQISNPRYVDPATVPKGKTAAQQFAEALGGQGLYSGTETSNGFNDTFFNGRRQAYIDYANPQLEDQYSKAQKELTFALARGGNLDSSVRGQKVADLQQLYDTNKQSIADQALTYEKEARSAVEDARSNLISMLNATGDAEGAANSAIARSVALSKPAQFSPLSNLFVDFTDQLGGRMARERADNAVGKYNAPTLFAPRSNAVKVTN